jgi:hypothetical protein
MAVPREIRAVYSSCRVKPPLRYGHAARKKSACADFLRGGEGGIRTHGRLATTPHFECGAFDHSATSPGGIVNYQRRTINDELFNPREGTMLEGKRQAVLYFFCYEEKEEAYFAR